MDLYSDAKTIVETLHRAGFIAYFAGGWVRDFLLQVPSDDIDIATNAPPEVIQTLFSKTVPIGIKFGILLVIVHDHPFEVATFRQDLGYKDGRHPQQVLFSSAEEDAKRRDFTINGLFFDPLHNKVLDFVGGQQDLKAGVLRAIGNPLDRLQEDRLRMIRASRLTCRFGLTMEPSTLQAIYQVAPLLLPAIAIERIVQEFKKAHNFQVLDAMLENLHALTLLQEIFPSLRALCPGELKQRLKPYRAYPFDAPFIAFIALLFPNLTVQGGSDLCHQLKLSNKDCLFIQFLLRFQTLPPQDRYAWTHFYADPKSPWVLAIEQAHLGPLDQSAKRLSHEQRRDTLRPYIQHMVEQQKWIDPQDLIDRGIPQGPRWRQLFQEAEKVAIDECLVSKEEILKRIFPAPLT
jgi:poly(A) polymerase